MGKINSVILSDKRTGSTFLYDCMGSHPNIRSHGEVFMISTSAKKTRGTPLFKHKRKTEGWGKARYLDWIFSPEEEVVFKLIYNQSIKWRLLPELMEREVLIIHLVRKDFFARCVSGYTKNLTNVKKVSILPNKIVSDIKTSIKNVDNFNKKLKKYSNCMTLFYEDIIGEVIGSKTNISKLGAFNIVSDQKTYLDDNVSRLICDKLNIPFYRMYSNVSKKNKDKWEYFSEADKKSIKKALIKNKLGKYIK